MPLAHSLSARVLFQLTSAEACEPNPHYRDDLRIARLTVAYAASGEAVMCSPHVLASYMVLGLHPEKVWPAIEARRNALGPLCALPLKKPAQSVKLWSKTNGARVHGSCAVGTSLRDQTISVPMATPSIAAGYPNSDAPSSEKKGEYSYDQALVVVAESGAPTHVRQLTQQALIIRGDWPNRKGPVTNVITVSVRSLQDKSGLYRSTVQRRIQRAKKDGYWREVRPMNSWLNCPKCGAERESAQCPKCEHRGNGHNPEEFRTTFTYAVDLEKFERTPPCRQVREIRELRARHSPKGLTVMPGSKPPEQTPPPKSPAPARREEPARKTAEHQRTVVNTQITADATKAAQRVFEFCGLADISLMAKIAIGIVAEARFQGIELQRAAKHIAETAVEQQEKKGVTLNAFYWRDLKWRTNGGQQTSASADRAERSKRNILDGLLANARGPDAPDSPEREE